MLGIYEGMAKRMEAIILFGALGLYKAVLPQ